LDYFVCDDDRVEARAVSGSRLRSPGQPRAPLPVSFTRSDEPCGVEIFTRTWRPRSTRAKPMAATSCCRSPDAGAISRNFRPHRAGGSDRLQLPLVAWKRMLILPLVVLLFSFAIGRRISTILHEWTALHWLRGWC